jgi:hypothetical protein
MAPKASAFQGIFRSVQSTRKKGTKVAMGSYNTARLNCNAAVSVVDPALLGRGAVSFVSVQAQFYAPADKGAIKKWIHGGGENASKMA